MKTIFRDQHTYFTKFAGIVAWKSRFKKSIVFKDKEQIHTNFFIKNKVIEQISHFTYVRPLPSNSINLHMKKENDVQKNYSNSNSPAESWIKFSKGETEKKLKLYK